MTDSRAPRSPVTRQRLGVVSQFTPRPKMVGWYDPGQLVRTGIDVIVSSIFGRYADRRLADVASCAPIAGQADDQSVDAQGEPRQELWLDYVADLGDGWNSTYNVAYTITRPTLQVPDNAGASHETRRADVLVFGGDQVYPVASRAGYQARLQRPYEAALRDSAAPHPNVYALPGNHDWYDNLVAFTRLFCTGRWFAGWRTHQQRSYFAVKLPHGWWLIGADVQLDSDIDTPQLDYFRSIAETMAPDDKIILCVPEPHWIYAQSYAKYDDNCNESNLAFLEERVFCRKIAVYLAGDLHHYRRHADRAGTQKITCGGGGAFLHPTHGPNVDVLRGGFTHRASYPPVKESRKLCWRNLLFPLLNPKFGLATGALYVLLAWAVNVDLSGYDITEFRSVVHAAFSGLVRSQTAAAWGTLLVGGFIFFTESHSKWFKRIAGTLHALAHLLAVLALGWWATFVTVVPWGREFESPSQLLLAGLLIFLSGAIIGPMIMGVYFLISLNLMGRHSGEAFSSLKIQDWKSFLRLHITERGLTIYPIGIRKVWRAWTINPGGTESPEWLPDVHAPARQRGTAPALIETPITVTRN